MRHLPTVLCLAGALTSMPAWANPTQQVELKIEVNFAEADANSDGKLSKEELSTNLITSITEQLSEKLGEQQAEQAAKQMAPGVVKSMFEKGDLNLDGFLTEEELKAAGL